MAEQEKKRKIILWIGAGLLILTAGFAILVLTGVITPVIFPPTGEPLDVSPLSSALVVFLMLIIILYVGTRVLDFGLKYPKNETE
ncbi:MAG: hypothetical protein HWN65_19375 [Candidatus Helarchaeota archaeon]|nr:hypothetical protein [Candidatus Helarchaeota archaeon]